jgi:hypothetical protein
MSDPCGECGHSKECHDSQGCVMCIAINQVINRYPGRYTTGPSDSVCAGYRLPGPGDQDPRDTQLEVLGLALDQALKALDLRMPSKVRLHLERAIELHLSMLRNK